MNGVVQGIKGLVGGSDIGILGGVESSIKDTLRTEFANVTSEFTNMVNSVINTILAPFMPMIEAALNEVNTMISRGMGAIQALLEGRFDQWIRELQLSMQDEVHAAQVVQTETQAALEFQVWEGWYVMGQYDRIPAWALNILNQYGSFAAYEAAADAAGIYSGQFDIDPSVIEDMLSNLNLPDFSDEEED